MPSQGAADNELVSASDSVPLMEHPVRFLLGSRFAVVSKVAHAL